MENTKKLKKEWLESHMVLVRDTPERSGFHKWKIALFFGRIDDQTGKYVVAGGGKWDECIPYEGNEHLLGTTDSPKGMTNN